MCRLRGLLPCAAACWAVLAAGANEVDATSEFATVVTYRLGQLRLLMAAEIDAQQQPQQGEPPPPQTYVEMKTYGYAAAAAAVTLSVAACCQLRSWGVSLCVKAWDIFSHIYSNWQPYAGIGAAV